MARDKAPWYRCSFLNLRPICGQGGESSRRGLAPPVLSHHRTVPYAAVRNRFVRRLDDCGKGEKPPTPKAFLGDCGVHVGCAGIPPRSTSVSSAFPCGLRINTRTGKITVASSPPFPLPPEDVPQPVSYLSVQILENLDYFADSAIVRPSSKDGAERRDNAASSSNALK